MLNRSEIMKEAHVHARSFKAQYPLMKKTYRDWFAQGLVNAWSSVRRFGDVVEVTPTQKLEAAKAKHLRSQMSNNRYSISGAMAQAQSKIDQLEKLAA